MIQDIQIKNLANIKELDFKNTGKINIIIGENDSGKTMSLKALYVMTKSIEEFNRGKDQRTFKEVISDKIYWTFQVNNIGDIVRKGSKESATFHMTLDGKAIDAKLSSSASKSVGSASTDSEGRSKNSIFLPAKEVLSLFNVIKKSRLIDQEFGFDDTYLDLVIGLEKSAKQGNNFKDFSKGKKILQELIKGRIELSNGEWIFHKGNMKIPIHSTAEGIKKIAILDKLLTNRTITPGSILFIDEPESVLHPKAIIEFLDILTLLAKQGVQIFMATHSFFVLKKMMLVAKQEKMDIPVVSMNEDSPVIYNLCDGMPDNPIVDVSIDLYEEELDLEL